VPPIVIAGGGIVGLCTAYALHRRGAEVIVVDAGPPEHAASHANAGWIVPSLAAPVPAPGLVGTSLRWMLRPGSPLYIRPRADLDFLRWLLAFWRHCNDREHAAGLEATLALSAQTMTLFDAYRADGIAFEEHRDGLLSVYHSPTALERDHAALAPLSHFGYPTPPILSGDALRQIEPVLTDAVIGGFLVPQERHLRPDSLVAALTARLQRAGVEIRPGESVIGIDRQAGDGASRVCSVITTKDRLAAEAVVICAGVWTPDVLRLAGAQPVPIQAGKGYSLDYTPPPSPVRRPLYLHESRVAVTPLNGTVRLAGTMEFSGLNHRLTPARLAAIARAGAHVLDGWPTDPSVATAWTGMRPLTPDGLPVIGFAPGWSNLAIASGHGMLGVTLGPVTGEAIADLLLGHPSELLQPFDPARFR